MSEDWRAIRRHAGEVLRNRLWREADGLCGICQQPIDPKAYGPERLTIDHIVAMADGGKDSIENMQPAHQSCNAAKGSEWGKLNAEMWQRYSRKATSA